MARQPVTFFASPKKVTQKRRPRCHCPSGSQLCKTKNGKASKLAALRQRSFLIHFLSCTIGSVRSGTALKSKATATPKQSISMDFRFLLAVVGRCFWLCFWPTPVWDDVICASQKMDKKVLLSERSEFQHFPIFCDAQIMLKRSVSTRRASLRSPFFCLLFLWRSKEK